MSRKRDRASTAAPLPEGTEAIVSPPSLPAVPSRSPSLSADSDAAVSFGSFLWNDVSILLFYRLMHEIHTTCLAVAKAAKESRADLLATFRNTMDVIWAVAQRHLSPEECAAAATKYSTYAAAFTTAFYTCVCGGDSGGGGGGGSSSDTAALCRGLLRLLEEQGFPEAEFGPLSALLAEVTLTDDTAGYSYSVRSSMAMPVPLRYDGDKRSEEEHARRRVGYEVVLPTTHAQPDVNTVVQLTEPKRRKPVLDEYRIFSLPKKAASFAADDFVVDDELLHRAYVVLATHLDAYGSLKGLSPYARLLLWNLLDRNDVLFSTLYDQHVSSESTRQQLAKLKELVAVHKMAFEETRPAARRAAAVISWYAASAQWRDQALSRLEELEEADWYLLADVYRGGGRAVFPNYSQSPAVTHLALGVLRKLDRLHSKELDGAPATHAVVEQLLLPLLQGEAPQQADFCSARGGAGGVAVDSAHWHRRRRKMRAVMDETLHKATHPTTASRGAPTTTTTTTTASCNPTAVHAYLCASLIFPLQCLGELLELCSLVMFSPMGFEAFTRSFLATNWAEEDTILAYLLRREPTNPSLVPLVGLPRLYRDLVTAIQLLVADRMLPYVVESRRLAGAHTRVVLQERSYPYWKSLATMFVEEDRFDDLCVLRVSTKENVTCLYTAAEVERLPKVWPEDLRELQVEEAQYAQERSTAACVKEEPTVAAPE